MKLIHRPLYINQLKDVLNTPDIKILTGIRRCGKSKLLAELIGYICSTDPKANIIDIDLKLIKNEPLREYHVLYNFITSHYRDVCPDGNATISQLQKLLTTAPAAIVPKEAPTPLVISIRSPCPNPRWAGSVHWSI